MSRIEIRNVLPDNLFTCFVVPSLFSREECEALLSTELKQSFQQAITNYPTYYRNNERFVKDDAVLAEQLFEKVKPYLPDAIETASNIQSENGTWKLLELNNRLRFCKYSANQYFNRHLDGIHYRSETVQSKLTFMIYLNSADEFEGGRTLFYRSKEASEIWASYIPHQGDLIVFDHNVWHEGEVLQSGEKFVLRSDILYSREHTDSLAQPFAGHLGYIWKLLKFDSKTLLSAGRDRAINVWDMDGALSQSLTGHQNSILCMEKMDDHTFISGSRDRSIIVWKKQSEEMETGTSGRLRQQSDRFEQLHSIQIHTALVLSLCRINDTTFASGGGDNLIQICTLEGTILKTFSEHTNWVWHVINLDEQHIASCSEDNTIKKWNLKMDVSVETIVEECPVFSLAYNRNTRQLICGDLSGMISIRTLLPDFSHTNIRRFNAHQGIVRTILFFNDTLMITGGEDNNVKIWDISVLENARLLSQYEHDNFVQSLEILNGSSFLSASYDGTIKIHSFPV